MEYYKPNTISTQKSNKYTPEQLQEMELLFSSFKPTVSYNSKNDETEL